MKKEFNYNIKEKIVSYYEGVIDYLTKNEIDTLREAVKKYYGLEFNSTSELLDFCNKDYTCPNYFMWGDNITKEDFFNNKEFKEKFKYM